MRMVNQVRLDQLAHTVTLVSAGPLGRPGRPANVDFKDRTVQPVRAGIRGRVGRTVRRGRVESAGYKGRRAIMGKTVQPARVGIRASVGRTVRRGRVESAGYKDLRDRLVTKGRSACVATPDLVVRPERGGRMVRLANAETRARAVRMVRPVQLDDVDYKGHLGMMDQLGRAVRPASVARMGHLGQPDPKASMVDRRATGETPESAVKQVKGAIRARSVEMDR